LSNCNSVKARAWVRQGKTTRWFDYRNWVCKTECSLSSSTLSVQFSHVLFHVTFEYQLYWLQSFINVRHKGDWTDTRTMWNQSSRYILNGCSCICANVSNTHSGVASASVLKCLWLAGLTSQALLHVIFHWHFCVCQTFIFSDVSLDFASVVYTLVRFIIQTKQSWQLSVVLYGPDQQALEKTAWFAKQTRLRTSRLPIRWRSGARMMWHGCTIFLELNWTDKGWNSWSMTRLHWKDSQH
jgi:hypothetical protein